MRKLLLFVLLLSPLAADICLAQANAINVVCEECRDPHEHPEDYVNFAFNQIYGPDAWMSFERADDFFITNLDGQKVYVDVDFVMLGFGLEGFRLPFWPTNLLQFTLAMPNGDVYAMLRSVFQTSLPVPSSNNGEPGDSNSGGGESADGGDDDDYNDDEDYDWDDVEIDGPEGSVTIEDPDEDGNFDDAEWCVEC